MNRPYLCRPKVLNKYAEVAQLVEHDLAKVGVAGSSLVFRSKEFQAHGVWNFSFKVSPGGGTGRRAGLKILFAAMRVRVQFPSGARFKADLRGSAFLLHHVFQEFSKIFFICFAYRDSSPIDLYLFVSIFLHFPEIDDIGFMYP